MYCIKCGIKRDSPGVKNNREQQELRRNNRLIILIAKHQFNSGTNNKNRHNNQAGNQGDKFNDRTDLLVQIFLCYFPFTVYAPQLKVVWLVYGVEMLEGFEETLVMQQFVCLHERFFRRCRKVVNGVVEVYEQVLVSLHSAKILTNEREI